MDFGQWETLYKATIVAGVVATIPVAILFYHFTRRKPDEHGRRKGRPMLTGAVALLTLIGPSLVPFFAFPEQAAEYQQRSAQQEAASDRQEQATQSEGLSQCLLWCDAVEECRGLARNRGGGVTDEAGQTACNRASSACTASCYERYPSIGSDR